MPMFKSSVDHLRDIQYLQQKLRQGHGKIDLENTHISNTLHNKAYKTNNLKLNLSSLNQIISIDTSNNTVIVEPGVTMEALCAASMPYGLIPCVVPEFKNITVGGAIMGAAGESSSFKFGLFNDTCLSYQLLLADGTILEVSPTQYADLFYGIAGSYGSLAILLQITLRLIPAKPFVRITCSHFRNSQEFFTALMETVEHSTADYIDAVSFAPDSFLLMEGLKVEKPIPSLYHLERPWSQWFIQRLRPKEQTLYLSQHDYLFRYDKAAFWMGSFIANWREILKNLLFWKKIKHTPGRDIRKIFQSKPLNLNPNLFYRLILSNVISSKILYQLLHQISEESLQDALFIHDFFIPPSKFNAFIEYAFTCAHIAPLWICPIKTTAMPQYLSPQCSNVEDYFINIGIYGCPAGTDSIPELSKKFESYVDQIGGRKILYSLNYYSEEKFWKTRNRPFYQELRKRYGAEGRLTDLYQKISNIKK